MRIDAIFRPKSVAIIGASNTRGKVGFVLANNLLKSGYNGQVYFVNIKGSQILGKQVYKSITDIPGEVDLAVIAIPAKFVIPTVEECGEKGVKAVIIISAGFKEMGGEGAELEKKLEAMQTAYESKIDSLESRIAELESNKLKTLTQTPPPPEFEPAVVLTAPSPSSTDGPSITLPDPTKEYSIE